MSQICIVSQDTDLPRRLAEAETFMSALRRNPEGSLAEVLGHAPGVEILGAEGDGLRIRTSPVDALDLLTSPTEISIHAGNEPGRTVTLMPEHGPMEDVVARALKTASGPSGPGGPRPSRGLKG